ncbi:serine/arginine repetitive matrix protein 1-like isoform X5 [Lagopus muta]|uniref:serine/arginine repetitive matrix protein 1-like isoform X5 n=1 Tax=Lagopus muta TaxID=64668 RepID=UPI0020A1F400|nr:serine/arginine repetitive matrix protein 1-like isoform X5 [Lagopus muta]
MGRVWGAMASARLILLLLMAASCCIVSAAPWQAPGADDYADSFHAVAWSDSAFVPEVEPGDVSGSEWGAESQPAPGSEALADGMELPPERAVPNAQLPPAQEPRWPPRGPARQRGKPGRGRYSPRFAHVLKAMTGEKEVPEIDGEPVDEAVLQEGSSHTLPISREGTEDVPAAGAAGAGGEEATKGIYIKDVPMFCLKGAIGVFVPILLLIIVCCICIRRRRKKQQRLMESAKARFAAGGQSAHEHRRSRHQRAPRVPGRPARVLRSSSPSRPPRPKRAPTRLPPARPPRPPSPAMYTRNKPQPRRAPPPPPPPSYRGW